MSDRERPGYLRNFGSKSTTLRKPTRLGEYKRARTPKYYKTFNELEVGKSYSEIQDANAGIFRDKWVKKSWPRGTFKGKRFLSAFKGEPIKYQFMFEKKNIDTTQDEINKGEKKFILNCPKGGYGARRTTAKVRRHTRRRLPSK